MICFNFTSPTAIPLFEVAGGLVAGTEASRGAVGPDRPERQWEYVHLETSLHQQVLSNGSL